MSATPHASPSFDYRAWSLCCITHDRGFFERHLTRALAEAPRHRINRLELHDYYIPWVNWGIAYRDYPAMRARPFTGARVPSDSDFDAAKGYIKDVFGRVKAAGLKLNVWYHVGRDVPPELPAAYPQYADIDSGFVYRFEEDCLLEFFERYPEVDAVTVTSLHETDSVLTRPGSAPRRERLIALYGAIARACRRAGRQFILRDFIARQRDFDDFLPVLDALPSDVVMMTKEVLGDWAFVRQERNPFLPRYRGRRLVVEFDLYGEYQGRGDVPYADPEYFRQAIRDLRPLGVEGAVGRIVHDYNPDPGPQPTYYRRTWSRSIPFPTVFDSLNEINVEAFSRTLYDCGPTLDSLGEFVPEMVSDAGRSLWLPWVRRRFGDKTGPRVIPLLQRTPALIGKLFTICGFWGAYNSHLATPYMLSRDYPHRRHWDAIYPQSNPEGWVRREPAAEALVRAEKDDLVQHAAWLLESARGLAAEFPTAPGFPALLVAIENLLLVAKASRCIALLFVLGVRKPAAAPALRALCEEADRLANQIETARDAGFFYALPAGLREWARWGAERMSPDHQPEASPCE